VPARDIGVATSTATTFRQLGGTLGVAIFFSLLFSTLPTKIADAFRQAGTTPDFQAALHDPAVLTNPTNQPVLDMLRGGAEGSTAGVLQDASFLHHIDPRLAHPFFVGFTESMTIVFACSAGIAVLAFLLFLFMKEVPLRNRSGSQEAAMEAALESAPGNVPPTAPVQPTERDSGR
jgi:hypothetical protein